MPLLAANDAERELAIDDRIEEWHLVAKGAIPGTLHEALGWTWGEYCAYVERGELPDSRKGAF